MNLSQFVRRSKVGLYVCCCVLCVSILGSGAHATSIVAKLDEEKIVIAADTLGIDATGIRHEDQCKFVLLGNYDFAAASISGFSSTWPNGPAWDTKIEAQAAYRGHEKDMEAAARNWLERAERYFSNLSVADRLRAGSLVA